MSIKAEHKVIIDKIVRLCKQEPEFDAELRKELKMQIPALSSYDGREIRRIREILEIRADNSISYDFIAISLIRERLIIDNLRMENEAMDLELKNRLVVFCVNAFYQMEALINYFFYCCYRDIDKIVSVVVEYTSGKYQYKPTCKECRVGDIDVYYKINAFCRLCKLDASEAAFFSGIRKIRNDFEHRGLYESYDEIMSKNAYFFNRYTIESVRNKLKMLVETIKYLCKK